MPADRPSLTPAELQRLLALLRRARRAADRTPTAAASPSK